MNKQVVLIIETKIKIENCCVNKVISLKYIYVRKTLIMSGLCIGIFSALLFWLLSNIYSISKSINFCVKSNFPLNWEEVKGFSILIANYPLFFQIILYNFQRYDDFRNIHIMENYHLQKKNNSKNSFRVGLN